MTAYASPDAANRVDPVAARLWIYMNFDCNLACTYCLTSSSPTAQRRALPQRAFEQLVDEAVQSGIADLLLTGGEPLLLPDFFVKLRYAASRVPTTVLTNGMLLHGRRLDEMRAIRHLPITLQISLDGATAGIHDAYRGAGSWAATIRGIRTAQELGLRVAIGATETPVNAGQSEALRAFVVELDIPEERFFLRPLTKRGFSAEGIVLTAEDVAPELTVTADGVFWHPQSAGEAMLLSRDIFPLREALALMTANLEVMRAGGPVPQQYRCA
jgi:MoaA/NifB/PqqE/SkfB family radical SAM enzyme